MSASWEVRQGDALERLAEMPDESVQCCVTSPPYFGLRDYGTGSWYGGDSECDHREGRQTGRVTPATKNGQDQSNVTRWPVCGRCGAARVDKQLGLEATPDEYVAALVGVFREVRRVLRDDGTLWLNLGDSRLSNPGTLQKAQRASLRPKPAPAGAKHKDLWGIPWMVAFALRADGWFLRSEIVWAKPNPMPESVRDRPTRAHEQVFLLSKRARYFYDAEAIREDAAASTMAHQRHEGTRSYGHARIAGVPGQTAHKGSLHVNGDERPTTANKRTVWTVATQPYPDAHFATFPPKLIEPMVLAGSSPQACGECGAPWERIVERTAMVVEPTPKRAAWQAEDEHARTQVGGTMVEPPTSKTVGWAPTCEHSDNTGSCTILDPFAGAGTTGLVSLRHGRSFVGIELNPDYCELARRRIRDDAPLMNTVSEVAA